MAHPPARPEALQEAHGTAAGIRSVMATHDRPDCLGSFVGMVEWDRGDVMVKDVGLDNTVHQSATDEPELAVNGGSGASGVAPRLSGVMRKRGIRVLEERDGH